MTNKVLAFLYLLITITATLVSEVEIGSISTLIYEYYDEPNTVFDTVPISKPLISVMPQFIWKDGRNMLLLNLEFFGSAGSLEGSFGKDGKLEGQLKEDSFYLGYIKESPFYLKFGKYPGHNSFFFGFKAVTGQGELGFSTESLKIFYSAIFYNLFNTRGDDGSYSYNNEKYFDDNTIIQMLGLTLKTTSNELKLRLPVEASNTSLLEALFPSINHNLTIGLLKIDSFAGLAYRDESLNIGLREELTFSYSDFKTKILGAHLTATEDREKSYNFTSLDNNPLEFHYGAHFNYLYQQAGNIYGLNTIGIYQSWENNDISLWFSLSSHFSVKDYSSENRESSYIGNIFSGGVKIYNIWSGNTLLEIYTSLFKPEGFSVIDGDQTRDLGFQLILKLQHIIF